MATLDTRKHKKCNSDTLLYQEEAKFGLDSRISDKSEPLDTQVPQVTV